MTEAKMGVEEIIKVLDVVVEGGNVAEKVGQADSVVGKVMALVPLSDELLRLMSLSPMKLRAQWKDLDDAEKQTLKDHAKKKFDIADDDLETKLEAGLELVSDVVDVVDRCVAYAKSFKKEG